MNIHGIWLGGNEMSPIARRCVSTWPEGSKIYSAAMLSSVVPWIHDIQYYRDAITAEHWAGASDVARLALLYELGGCYLDVDVEICDLLRLDSLDDGWFHIASEDGDSERLGNVCGAAMVSPPFTGFIRDMLDIYRRTNFTDTFNGKCNGTTLLTRAIVGDYRTKVHPAKEFYPWHWSEKLTDNQKGERIELLKPIVAHHWEHQWEQINGRT